MKLKGIIGAQADVEAGLEKIRKRVSLVSQEKCIITQWAHRDPNLFQVKQILESGYFPQEDPV